MPRIIVFGDIDISPLYLTLDDYREITLAGKWPLCLHVEAGYHDIAATTITKFQRNTRTSSDTFLGWAANAMTNGMNSSIAGRIELEDDEILLIQVKKSLTKSYIYNRVVDASQADRFLDMDSVVNYGERAPGEKNKWVAFFLCLFLGFLGAHRFYEGKIVTGILYLCTLGLCGIGVLVDLVKIWQRSGSAVPASERASDQGRSSGGGGILAVVLVSLLAVVIVGGGAMMLFVRPSLSMGGPVPTVVTPELETPPEATPEPDPSAGFIFPHSDTGLIGQWELETLSDSDLNYAINEIYARHGYIFRSAELSEYFKQFSWYIPTTPSEDFSTSCFNQYEQQNWKLLVDKRTARKNAG